MYCAARGWPVVNEYADEGISGGKQVSRIDFQRMMKAGTSNEPSFDLVLTRDQARFGRGDDDNGNRAKLREHGVRVDNIESPVGDMTSEGVTTGGRTMERVKAAFDIQYREEIAPRTRAGQRQKAQRGGMPGRNGMMFGYRSVYEGHGPNPTRRVIPHEVNAPIVAEMFRRAADDHSIYSIAKWLRDNGIVGEKGGAAWAGADVKRILTNETALGRIVYGRLRTVHNSETERHRFVPSTEEPTRFEGAFEPLIDRDTWDAVQRRFAQPRKTTRNGGNAGNLLRGVGKCKCCGWGLAFQKRQTKWFYLCESKKQKGALADARCSGTLPQDYVKAVLRKFVRKLLSFEDHRATFGAAVDAYNRAAHDHTGISEIGLLRMQIRTARTKRENWIKAIGDGVPVETLRIALQLVETEIFEREKRLADVTAQLIVVPVDKVRVLDAMDRLREATQQDNPETLRALLGEIVERIEVDLTKRANRRVTFDFYMTLLPAPDMLAAATAAGVELPSGSMDITANAPLRFVMKWDLRRLEHIHEVALLRIGSLPSIG